MVKRALTTFLVALLVPLGANAQAENPSDDRAGLAPPTAKKDDSWAFSGLAGTTVGFGQIDEDWFTTINFGAAFQFGKLGLGVQVPLRLRTVDVSPKADPKRDGEIIRKADWDEVSDWTRIIQYISWGQPNDEIYARLGVLTGTTLGHGTIVDRYYNVVDVDHYQTGVQLHLDFKHAGGTFFMDNLIHPEMFGTRGFVRPFRFFSGLPEWLNDFVVGTTLFMDVAGPLTAQTLSNGHCCAVNGDGEVRFEGRGSVSMLGFDLGWEVAPADWVALTPYLDGNLLTHTGGGGMHLGILSSFNILDVVRLGARIEYRVMDETYAPGYVNSWYEIERIDFLQGKTKAKYFRDIADRPGPKKTLHGWHASLDLTILDAVTITGILEDYQGRDNSNLMLRLILPYIVGVKLQAYYAKRNFNGIGEAFNLDRGLLVAEARYKFWGPLFVYGMYRREWRLAQNSNEADFVARETGRYETINDWDFGVGVEFEF